MPLNIPYLGKSKFPSSPIYRYDFIETIEDDVSQIEFQAGKSVRILNSSLKRRRFTLKFNAISSDLMNDLERFYRDMDGGKRSFLFEPPIEKSSGRYAQLLADGSQQLQNFTSAQLRAGNQSVVVKFTQPFNRTIFYLTAENTGLVLEEVFGEDEPGKYINFDGLFENQNATVPQHLQFALDLGSKDFMWDFLFRGETVFVSSSASYAAMTGLDLDFTVGGGTPFTVTFTAAAIDASTTAKEINDQHGDKIECLVYNTDELRMKSLQDSSYFIIGGTALAQLNLSAPIIFPIHKHDEDSTGTGYYFKQDGTGDLTFFMESGGTGVTITADSLFNLLDGAWHYIAVVIDKSGNGQIYVDGAESGVPVSVSSVGSLDNIADFSLHQSADSDIQMKRVSLRSWDSGDLPDTISTTISNLHSDWEQIDVADETGLQVLWPFDDETGVDIIQEHDLILNNSPAFFEFDN